jgi:hypothetical protein
MALGISYRKITCMVLLFLVIVISLVLSNIPFLVSDHKASMVKLEGMTLGASPSPSLSPSPSHSPSPYPSPTMKSLSPSIASDIMPAKY